MRKHHSILLSGLMMLSISLLSGENAFADVAMNGQIQLNAGKVLYDANFTTLTVNTLAISGQELDIRLHPLGQLKQFNFSSASISPSPFDVQIQKMNPYEIDFKILPTLSDVNGTTNGTKLYSITVDGTSVTNTWNGVLNSFSVGSGKIVREIFVGPTIIRAYLSDAATALYGSILQSNTTSSNNAFTLFSGIATIPGTNNQQNFSAKNALTNFIVKKQYNFDTSASQSLNITTNDWLVKCPFTGPNNAIEVTTNETDGHRISSFTVPTCYANNTVKWSTTFLANGLDTNTYNTIVYVKVLNNTYLNIAPLKWNNTKVSTAVSNPYIVSSSVTVGTGSQTRLFNWSLNLTTVPVNFTIGFINVTAKNYNTVPITFARTDVNSTFTNLAVNYPSSYNLACTFGYSIEQTNKTYGNLAHTTPTIGTFQTVFGFKTPNNDIVDVTCKDLTTNASGKYTLSQTTSTIPLVQQIKDFQNGKYGTKGQFGTIDIVTFIVIIISFIGMNRVNETVGVIISVMIIGVMAFFQLITFPTVMISAIALVILVTVASTKKLPWS